MTDERKEEGERPLGETYDLSAWEEESPPGDFAERVLDRVMAERATARVDVAPPRTPRRWAFAGGAAAVAIAAAVLLRASGPPEQGEAIAKDRTEVRVGHRALAVLESGANVKWNGDDVVQSRGDVFYRVEPGARFTVHTPAGDVEVKGTCFAVKVRPGAGGNDSEKQETDMMKRDVKAGGVGAALTALAFVAVYEGRVAVSHASERVELTAGESAQASERGVKLTGATAQGEKAFAASAAAAADNDDPANAANRDLVKQVGEYRQRLEAIVAQKVDLESKLKKSEERLASSQDGGQVRTRSDFDLTPDDWKELAKDGTIKFQAPCMKKDGWTPGPEKLNALGLAPQDAATIKNAYVDSNKRVWAQVRPLCAQAVGGEALADKIGPDTCVHLVLDVEREKNGEAAQEARKLVGEIRAGLRPMPGPNEKVNPVTQLFLAMTGESDRFEADLAQSLGPEEAHRVVYSGELCMGTSIYGGGGGSGSPKK